jgi:hypothetical protein
MPYFRVDTILRTTIISRLETLGDIFSLLLCEQSTKVTMKEVTIIFKTLKFYT